MLSNNFNSVLKSNFKNASSLTTSSLNLNTIDSCPNCGNTRPLFQHVQNGMIVCFICRKASSFSEKNSISAY